MGSDCDAQIRVKADQQLKEIDKKYPGFIQVSAVLCGKKYTSGTVISKAVLCSKVLLL